MSKLFKRKPFELLVKSFELLVKFTTFSTACPNRLSSRFILKLQRPNGAFKWWAFFVITLQFKNPRHCFFFNDWFKLVKNKRLYLTQFNMCLLPSRTTARENLSQKFKNLKISVFLTSQGTNFFVIVLGEWKKIVIQEFYQQGRLFQALSMFFIIFRRLFFAVVKSQYWKIFSFLHANLPANTCIKQGVTGKAIMLYFMTPWA